MWFVGWECEDPGLTLLASISENVFLCSCDFVNRMRTCCSRFDGRDRKLPPSGFCSCLRGVPSHRRSNPAWRWWLWWNQTPGATSVSVLVALQHHTHCQKSEWCRLIGQSKHNGSWTCDCKVLVSQLPSHCYWISCAWLFCGISNLAVPFPIVKESESQVLLEVDNIAFFLHCEIDKTNCVGYNSAS